MKTSFLIIVCFFYSFFSYSQIPSSVWSKSVNVNANRENIGVDHKGNVYQTGFFKNVVDFDPSVSIYNLTATDSPDIFISKTDENGNFIWAKSFSSGKSDIGYSLSIDDSNNVYCVGTFKDTVDFDPGTGVYKLKSSRDGSRPFIVKLDENGTFIWAKTFQGNITPRKISNDVLNNVYFIGYFSDSVDFNYGYSGGKFNGEAGFIVKLNSSGNFVWAKKIGASDAGLLSFAVNRKSEIYCTGYFESSTFIDPEKSFGKVTGAGTFITKYNIHGDFLWVKQIDRPATSSLYIWSIRLDSNSNIYGAGQFGNKIDFDPGPLDYSLVSKSISNVVVFKFDSSGKFNWANHMGEQPTRGLSITVDGLGNTYTQGAFQNTVDFDPEASSLE